jgi:hypothetical protein
MDSYEHILEGIPREVSLGMETIRLYPGSALQALQIGYSIRPTGEYLTGTMAGDWRKEWVVIGYAESCGDPIFIDSSRNGFPVYTAMHSEGS